MRIHQLLRSAKGVSLGTTGATIKRSFYSFVNFSVRADILYFDTLKYVPLSPQGAKDFFDSELLTIRILANTSHFLLPRDDFPMVKLTNIYAKKNSEGVEASEGKKGQSMDSYNRGGDASLSAP